MAGWEDDEPIDGDDLEEARDRIRDVALPAPSARALQIVVDGVAASIAAAVRARAASDPVYACCLWGDPSTEDDDFSIGAITLGREADRVALLEQSTGWDAIAAVWNPNEMAGGEFLIPTLDRPEIVEASTSLSRALVDVVEDPHTWVACRVARQLTVEPPPLPRTGDFVAYLLDTDLAEQLVANIEFACTPPIAAALRRLGVLPPA